MKLDSLSSDLSSQDRAIPDDRWMLSVGVKCSAVTYDGYFR